MQILLLLLAFFGPELPYRIRRPINLALDSEHFQSLMEVLTDAQLYRKNDLAVLTNGDQFYRAELDATRSAKRSISLEAYIFQKGDISGQFVSALTEHAKAGVDVKLIIDYIGSFSTFRSYFRALATHLGMECVFGKARELAGKDYGSGILARGQPLASRNFDLSVRGREPRSCLRVDFSFPAVGNLHLFNVHLGTSFFERRVQAERMVSSAVLGTRDIVFPRVLMGDFNEWTRGKVSRTLAKYMCSADLAEHLAWRRTYPGTLPFLHLDHVYHDRNIKLTHMRIHRSAASLVASDHLTLVSILERA